MIIKTTNVMEYKVFTFRVVRGSPEVSGRLYGVENFYKQMKIIKKKRTLTFYKIHKEDEVETLVGKNFPQDRGKSPITINL